MRHDRDAFARRTNLTNGCNRNACGLNRPRATGIHFGGSDGNQQGTRRNQLQRIDCKRPANRVGFRKYGNVLANDAAARAQPASRARRAPVASPPSVGSCIACTTSPTFAAASAASTTLMPGSIRNRAARARTSASTRPRSCSDFSRARIAVTLDGDTAGQ